MYILAVRGKRLKIENTNFVTKETELYRHKLCNTVLTDLDVWYSVKFYNTEAISSDL